MIILSVGINSKSTNILRESRQFCVSKGRSMFHLSMNIVNCSTLMMFHKYLRPYPRTRHVKKLRNDIVLALSFATFPAWAAIYCSSTAICRGKGSLRFKVWSSLWKSYESIKIWPRLIEITRRSGSIKFSVISSGSLKYSWIYIESSVWSIRV